MRLHWQKNCLMKLKMQFRLESTELIFDLGGQHTTINILRNSSYFAELSEHKKKAVLIAENRLQSVGAESRNRTGTPCGAGF